MQPKFLSLARALRLHRSSIEHYGGDPGVRDMGLLESALAQPRATFGKAFLHEDLAAMAAAYLYHIVCNHPFVDGNKRTGALAAFVFLEMNDTEFTASENEFGTLVLSVARGETSKELVTEFFRKHIKH
jgi:death-on-curing protein